MEMVMMMTMLLVVINHFVQNEYEGIVKQLKELQLDEKQEIYFSDLAQQKLN